MPPAPATLPADPARYLHPSTLAAVGSIELRARMIVEGLQVGMHRSPMQGFSVEFAQHRPYTAGDDTRFLDWKVYGKTDKLYLKQYQKETNLDMVLLVDSSGSMAYGSRSDGAMKGQSDEESQRPSFWRRLWGSPGSVTSSLRRSVAAPWRKFDHAAALAAAMSHLALRQQDRVALTLFSDAARRATRLSNASDHWRSILGVLGNATLDESREMDDLDPSRASEGEDNLPGRTDLLRLFDTVNATLIHRSLVVLISDLFDSPSHLERGLAKLKHRRHDVIVLQVLDPTELEFPFRSPSDFIGLEAEGKLALDPAALRQDYLDALQTHLRAVERAARKFGFDYLLLDSSQSVGPPLSHFLAKRAAMLARKG